MKRDTTITKGKATANPIAQLFNHLNKKSLSANPMFTAAIVNEMAQDMINAIQNETNMARLFIHPTFATVCRN